MKCLSLQDSIRVAAGGCIGALSTVVPEPEFNNLVKEHLIGEQ